MPLQARPTKGLRDPNQETRDRETLNKILSHEFDDSRVQTPEEKLAGVTPINRAYPPGDVRRYGAVLDGVTDDSAAWDAANDQAAQGGFPIFVPRTDGGLATPRTLFASPLVDVEFEPGAFVYFTGSAEEPAIQCGDASVTTEWTSYKNLRVRRASQSDWSDDNCIGVKLSCLRTCDISVHEASGFTIGVQCIGEGLQFAGNVVRLGDLRNSLVGLELTNTDGISLGFCNSNTFIGGYITNDTGVNSVANRFGVRIDSSSATPYYNNANVFINLTMELNTAGSGVALPIQINYGTLNRWYDCRDELNDSPFMQCNNDSRSNIAEVTYGFGSAVVNNGAYFDNFVLQTALWAQSYFAPVWQSPPWHLMANEFDGAGAAYFPGGTVRTSTNGDVLIAASGFNFTDDYVDFANTRALGVMVDTRRQKRFVLRRDTETTQGGRWIVICYDSSGTQLTSAGAAHPYAVSQSGSPLQYTANFGGAYITGGDDNNDVFVGLKSAVTWVFVGIAGGTSNARIRSISIQSLDGGAVTVFQGFEENSGIRLYNDQIRYASAAPATSIGLTYPKGLRLHKWLPSAGGSPGWVCTTTGAGGTAVFKEEADLDA